MTALDDAVTVVEQYSAEFSRMAAQVSELRDMLAECQALCAAQQDTIAALRVEIAAMRRRHEMTPDQARAMLRAAGV